MSLEQIGAGLNAPDDINVIIEIAASSDPIKYEICKNANILQVDRILATSMSYPANYGYVPHTLCEDGDPIDVLVVTPYPLMPGCVIRCRPIGLLVMEDEAGKDSKVLALPIEKVTRMYNKIEDVNDMPDVFLNTIVHFFEHYKKLSPEKWVKVEGWENIESAKKAITKSIKMYSQGTPPADTVQ
jgi:inorganic pyrophosphatase